MNARKAKKGVPPVITIDGPVASGKTSVSRELARRLQWSWVSTGAFYRGLAYVAQQENVDLQDSKTLAGLASSPLWSVELSEEETRVVYKNQDVTQEIRSEQVGAIASQISQYPDVRKSLLQAQRDCLANVPGLIAEGRDCGSVVFPQAKMKFYLTARSDSRAQRRAQEHGQDVQEIQTMQKERDSADQNRSVAPLQIPEGAIVIDTSQIGLNEVVETLYQHIQKV